MKCCKICGELFIPSKFHPNRQKCCLNPECRKAQKAGYRIRLRQKDGKREQENALQMKRRRLNLPLLWPILAAFELLFKQSLHQILPVGTADAKRIVTQFNRNLTDALCLPISRLNEMMETGGGAAFTP
jgi:hypothetical protein